jgi:hypothetical protein
MKRSRDTNSSDDIDVQDMCTPRKCTDISREFTGHVASTKSPANAMHSSLKVSGDFIVDGTDTKVSH